MATEKAVTVSFSRFVNRSNAEPAKSGWACIGFFDLQVDTPFGPMIVKDFSVMKNVAGDGTRFIGFPSGPKDKNGKRWDKVRFTNALDKAQFEKACIDMFDQLVALES